MSGHIEIAGTVKWLLQIRLLWMKRVRTGGKTRVVPRAVTHSHFTDDKTETHKEVTRFVSKPGLLFLNAILFFIYISDLEI